MADARGNSKKKPKQVRPLAVFDGEPVPGRAIFESHSTGAMFCGQWLVSFCCGSCKRILLDGIGPDMLRGDVLLRCRCGVLNELKPGREQPS
jgi:hypothetical protein